MNDNRALTCFKKPLAPNTGSPPPCRMTALPLSFGREFLYVELQLPIFRSKGKIVCMRNHNM
jgi:hypothetical protein